MNQATVRLLSREAASLSSSGGKEITAVRCRNYTSASSSSKPVATKPSIATPQSNNNSKKILIPAHDGSSTTYMIFSRALSSSTRLSVQGSQASTTSQSQSSQSLSSSLPVTSSNTIKSPSPATQGLLGGIAKLMGYDTRTSAAIRTTSDYYDRCSERDEKEGTFWYDGELELSLHR